MVHSLVAFIIVTIIIKIKSEKYLSATYFENNHTCEERISLFTDYIQMNRCISCNKDRRTDFFKCKSKFYVHYVNSESAIMYILNDHKCPKTENFSLSVDEYDFKVNISRKTCYIPQIDPNCTMPLCEKKTTFFLDFHELDPNSFTDGKNGTLASFLFFPNAKDMKSCYESDEVFGDNYKTKTCATSYSDESLRKRRNDYFEYYCSSDIDNVVSNFSVKMFDTMDCTGEEIGWRVFSTEGRKKEKNECFEYPNFDPMFHQTSSVADYKCSNKIQTIDNIKSLYGDKEFLNYGEDVYYFDDKCSGDEGNIIQKQYIPIGKCVRGVIQYSNNASFHKLIYNDLNCYQKSSASENMTYSRFIHWKKNFSECIPYTGSLLKNSKLVHAWKRKIQNEFNCGTWLGMIPVENRCDNYTDEDILEMKEKRSSNIVFTYDTCINENNYLDNVDYALKAYCDDDGKLTIRNYTHYKQIGSCDYEYETEIPNKKYKCIDNQYIFVCVPNQCTGDDMKDGMKDCSGNGKCGLDDKCICDVKFFYEFNGDYCQSGSITISGIIVILLFFFILIVVIIIFSSIILLIWVKTRKYRQLEDFDILLSEQNAYKKNRESNQANIKVDSSKYKIAFEDLKIISKIGSGGSNSIVFLCEMENIKCAFKCFRTDDICEDQKIYDEFEKEVSILIGLNFPYILHCYGGCLKEPRIGIVMEYCEHGDLKNFLIEYEQKNKYSYPLNEKIRMCFEISAAYNFIHNRYIIHRDLKCENVLVSGDFQTKLMDFGLSKVIKNAKTKTTNVGTSHYMAPEIMSGQYDHLIDVFSCSMVFFEIITNNFNPFGVKSEFNIEKKIASDPEYRPSEFSNKFKDCEWMKELIVSMWNHTPYERPGFDKILEIIKENMIVPKKMVKNVEVLLPKEEQLENLRIVENTRNNQIIEDLKKENELLKIKIKELSEEIINPSKVK